MRIRLSLLTIATAATLALTGCGGDPSTTENASGETTPATTQPADPSESPEASPSATEPQETKAPDKEAPEPTPESLDFTTTTVDGKPFEGASLAGKPTVMWFWAAWCPKCRGSAPAFKQAADKFGDKVNLIGVAGKSNAADMQTFISDYDLSGLTHLADRNDPLWSKYGITYQHKYVVIDKAGKIVHTGELSEQELTDRLTELAG